MGNWLWCSHGSGERLASAAKEGDVAEVKMLLEANPWLPTYSSTFSALNNSPLHLAASNAHTHIVMLLLEYGADVNSRNFSGQTALMQACRRGHWEVVQALLLFKPNVTRTEFLTRKTALHFAAAGGHIRCIRLLVADFIPSAPSGSTIFSIHGDYKGGGSSHSSSPGIKCDHSSLSRFVNKVADNGVTALHLAALNGHADCAQLLLDLRAHISAVTHHYGSSPKMIGTRSTPLHFAACGGDLKSCQVLLARGACRLTLNCNGWLPVDVAKMWGHRYLIPLLSPNSDLKVPTFPPSGYLALPLMSALNIARACRLKSLTASSDENDLCAVCLENTCSVAAEDCRHELCVKCALYLCSTSNITSQVGGPPGSIPCPLCRNAIVSFIKLACTPVDKLKLNDFHSPPITCRSELRQNFMVPSLEAWKSFDI